jgi:hypothetical protein
MLWLDMLDGRIQQRLDWWLGTIKAVASLILWTLALAAISSHNFNKLTEDECVCHVYS